MPDLAWNKAVWDGEYDWTQGGEEWSGPWGGSAMQWYRTILPRIHAFVPTGTILEIAPGFGRWTQHLKELCDRLFAIDLSERCIAACRERFAADSHISYHTNDGTSLEMVPDSSIDFLFSFDSLVHVELDVLHAYLNQIRHKLTPAGLGFLHHSNLGAYGPRDRFIRRLPRLGQLALERLGWLERNRTLRAPSVSAELFAKAAVDVGLACLTQELVNWGSRRLTDCFSLFALRGSCWERPNRVIRNHEFMAEARSAAQLASGYGRVAFGQDH